MKYTGQNNAPFYRAVIIAASIAIITVLSLIMSGCNTEKRAVRQAVKIQAKHPFVMASACASYYPGIDSIHESIVYKEGTPIVKSDTVTITDTLTNKVTEYITKRVNTHDTAFVHDYKQIVNRAKETELSDKVSEQDKTIAGLKAKGKIMLWVLIVLGVYTIGRWILRIWNIKLP